MQLVCIPSLFQGFLFLMSQCWDHDKLPWSYNICMGARGQTLIHRLVHVCTLSHARPLKGTFSYNSFFNRLKKKKLTTKSNTRNKVAELQDVWMILCTQHTHVTGWTRLSILTFKIIHFHRWEQSFSAREMLLPCLLCRAVQFAHCHSDSSSTASSDIVCMFFPPCGSVLWII